MTERPFTAVPISTWLQIATVLVVIGISYATVVSSNQSLADDQTALKNTVNTTLNGHEIRIRTLETSLARFEERMINLNMSVNDMKQIQRETNNLLRNIQNDTTTR